MGICKYENKVEDEKLLITWSKMRREYSGRDPEQRVYSQTEDIEISPLKGKL